jgi:membrane associated rhomboid family serine protease
VLRPGSPSPVVLGLMVLCGAVFLLGLVPGVGERLIDALALVPGVSGVGSGRLWQLVSYAIVHMRPFHLLLNLLMLYMFGCRVERWMSSKTFVGFVVVAAATAGVCSWLLASLIGSGDVQVMGASGVVFAILTMWALLWPNEEVWLALLFPIRVKWLVVVLVVFAALSLLSVSGRDGVAHEAHLGGCLAAAAWWWLTVRRPGSGTGRPSGRRRRHLRLVSREDDRFREIVQDL